MLVTTAVAADFRIENKVFVGTEKEPAVESVTIFKAGVVYDYLADPAEVTVFDPSRQRFLLLDVARRLKTELPLETVSKGIEELKTRGTASEDPRLRFFCDPKFDEKTDEESGEQVFTSPWVEYRVTSRAIEDRDVAKQYRQFADWHAKLNAFLRPGSPPPFARLLVNEALVQREVVPENVTVTLVRKQGLVTKRTTLRSQHRLSRRLLESDHRRIAQTDEYLAIFSPIGYQEYEARIAAPTPK